METSQYSIESEPEVIFVYTNASQELTEMFNQTFKTCQEADIKPKKLSAQECLVKKMSNKNDIYIIDSFESDAFTYLDSFNARILGAPCVMYCLKHCEDLPNEGHPVFAMCMKDTLITITGVAANERAELVRKIEWLGGVYTPSLVKTTTHLIAQETSSKKYQASVGLKIPILTVQWVEESYAKSKTMLFDAKEKKFISNYYCPPFLGCVVTSSGLMQREEIKALVENGGGVYSGQMVFRECTHLVIEQPTGEKYHMARKWGSVYIVNPTWVKDSYRSDYKMPEDDPEYTVSREVSTPEKCNVPQPNIPDISAIHSTSISHMHIDETLAAKRRRSSEETFRTSNGAFIHIKSISPTEKKCDVLANVKICLRGFDEMTAALLNRVVNSCGATVSMSTTNCHYVIAPHLDLDTLNHMKNSSVPVLSPEWLKQVYQKQTMVDINPYILHKSAKRQNTDTSEQMPPAKRRSVLPTIDTDVSNFDTELTFGRDKEDLLSQYAGSTTRSTDDKKTLKEIANKQDSTPQVVRPSEATSPTPSKPPLSATPSRQKSALIFDKCRFCLHDLSNDELEEVIIKIKSNGGRVVKDQSNADADFIVRSTIITYHTQFTQNSVEVSVTWVRACDRSNEKLKVDSNPLFKPLVVPNANLLSKCVISTTGLNVYERDALYAVISRSGGMYVEELRRFASGNQPATTHLICQTEESAKYKAAKQWGIATVKIRWITDSMKNGKLLPVGQYHPSLQDSVESDGKTDLKSQKKEDLGTRLAAFKTPLHSRIKALRLDSGASSAKKQTGAQKFLSTSIIDDPDKSFHIDLDTDLLETPAPPNPITPIDEALDKYLQLGLEKHYVLSPDQNPNNILAGTIVCLSKGLLPEAKNLAAVITSLGGECRPSFFSGATHFVFKGKATESEYRAARQNKQYIVCPYWLHKCKEEKRRVDEAQYPYNFDIKKQSMDTSPRTPSIKRTDVLKRGPLEFSPEDKKENTSSEGNENPDMDEHLADALNVLKQIKSYTRTKCLLPIKETSTNAAVKAAPSPITAYKPDKAFQPESQNTEALVTWDDHTSRTEHKNIENHVELDSQELAELKEEFTAEKPGALQNTTLHTADFTDGTLAVDRTRADIVGPDTNKNKKIEKVFQFSGFKDEERDEMAAKLQALGAKCITDSLLDKCCTHVILYKPVRNEKFLCALVCGLWLLDKSYVDSCIKAGRFVSEEPFEWGGSGTEQALTAAVVPFAKAAQRRRLMAQAGNLARPFMGWKVLLLLNADKQGTMMRVLELGGAAVLANGGSPISKGVCTHAFIDNKAEQDENYINKLIEMGVNCLKPEYIPAYLVNDGSVNLQKHKYIQK